MYTEYTGTFLNICIWPFCNRTTAILVSPDSPNRLNSSETVEAGKKWIIMDYFPRLICGG